MNKNIKEWLNTNNLTEEDLDWMWDFCYYNDHKIIKNLKDHGKDWRDLSETAIKTLPETYNKLLYKILTKEE